MYKRQVPSCNSCSSIISFNSIPLIVNGISTILLSRVWISHPIIPIAVSYTHLELLPSFLYYPYTGFPIDSQPFHDIIMLFPLSITQESRLLIKQLQKSKIRQCKINIFPHSNYNKTRIN